MSKMNDMALTIKELRDAADAINDVANWLEKQFSNTSIIEEAKPTLTLEQVRGVLANKSRAGYAAGVRALIQKYDAQKLSDVDPKNYESLLKDAEELK